MRSLLRAARQVEADEPGISNVEILVGFGWSDAAHSGASVTVTARDADALPAARAHAVRLAALMWQQRAQFQIPGEVVSSADEAIDRALAAPESTVFVTDVGDNPTAGASGDVPHVLARLVARQVPDAVVDIFDAEASSACFSAGAGATVSLTIGAKLDTQHGSPVPLTGVVEHLYRPSSPREVPVAVLRAGGVRVLLPARRKVFTRLNDYRSAGIDPLAHKLLVVKQGYLFPELHDIAPREILALTPGFADMALDRLPYREVQRPIYPLDPETHFSPQAWMASRS
jgi:microcystin degradation protein MlrC